MLAIVVGVADFLQAHRLIRGENTLVDLGDDLEFFVDEFCANALIGEDVACGRQIAVVVELLAKHCFCQIVDCVIAHLRVEALLQVKPILDT